MMKTESVLSGQKRLTALFFKDKKEFRAWLVSNHARSKGIWLILHRKEAGLGKLTLKEANEEALCFGWIDSQIKKLDAPRFILRFSPRRSNSPWSEINKRTAQRMIRIRKMTKAGLEKIKAAKQNGWWAKAYRLKRERALPSDLMRALKRDKTAWANFNAFAVGQRNQYIYWVEDAKREETRKKRITLVVQRARKNLKPGVDP
jgi:uncharacterized protein YdeI (YjbR/CyaY-like superfamily)